MCTKEYEGFHKKPNLGYETNVSMAYFMSKKNKRCLIIITGAFHTDGGIAGVNRLTIKAIAEDGYSIDLYSLLENETTVDARYLLLGTQISPRSFSGNKYSLTLAVWYAILNNRYDYIIVDHINLASILAPFAWIKLCRYVVWLFGVDVFPPRPDLEGWLGLQGAWKRLAISEFTKQSVTSRFPKLQVEVCDLSLDPVRHPEITIPGSSISRQLIVLPASDGSQSQLRSRVILHVGRMTSSERYKGQDSLINAFPLVYEQNPDAQLVLVGQGDDLPRLKGLAQTFPRTIGSHIFFPGYVADDLLNQIYQACYVFAMPSIGEGFGLVYLEAMSRGKPCLAGNVDAAPIVVIQGITGLLVEDPRSPEQVAITLNWFLAHPEETQEMGRRGAERVRSYYLFPHFQQRFWKGLKA